MRGKILRLQIIIPLMISAGAHFFMISTVGTEGGHNAASKIYSPPQNLVSIHFVSFPPSQISKPEISVKDGLAFQQAAPIAHPKPLVLPAPDDKNSLIPVKDVAQPYYFRVKELTQKPVPISDLQTYIRSSPDELTLEPTVLRLYINEEGEIDNVETETTGLSDETIATLKEIFKKAKFVPGKIDELNVKSQLRIEVTLQDAFSKYELNRLSLPALK